MRSEGDQMKILKTIDQLPGGIILVPMLCSALVNTLAPELLQVGGVTTKLFSTYGTQVFIGALLFLSGSQLAVRDVPKAMKRGGVLLLGKILIGVLLTALYLALWGQEGVFGIPALAFCVVVLSVNPGVFLAVANQHGDELDPPGFGLFNLLSVPTVPLVVLGVLDGGAFDYMSITTTLFPFLFGMLLGNLDPDMKRLFSGATKPILFFAGFNFGAAVDLFAVIGTGFSGFILSLVYIIFCAFGLLLIDRLVLRRPGYAAASLSAVAGAAVSMPAIIGETLPQYAVYGDAATALVACCVVFTTIFNGFFTKWILHYAKKNAAVS